MIRKGLWKVGAVVLKLQRCEKDGSGRSAANAKTLREDELQKRGPCDKGTGSAKESDVRWRRRDRGPLMPGRPGKEFKSYFKFKRKQLESFSRVVT